MTRLMKRGITVAAGLVVIAGVVYVVQKSYNKNKQNTFSVKLSAGRVNYNVASDCVTVEDPQYDAAYPLDPRDGCEPLKCARHALATSNHLTDDDQIAISSDNPSAVGNLDRCLSQHPGGTAFMVGHGSQGEIDTAFSGNDWYLSNKNHPQWTSEFQKLRNKSSAITLWGCSTGGGSYGTDLLQQIQSDVCTSPQSACTTSIKSPTVPVFCDDNGLYFSNGEQWNYGNGSPEPQGAVIRMAPAASGPLRAQSSRSQDQTTADTYSADKFLQIFWEQNSRVFRKLESLEDKNRFFNEINLLNKIETSGCPVSRKEGIVELYPVKGDKQTWVFYSNGLLRDLSRTDAKVYYQGSDALVNSWMTALQPH